MKKILIAIGVLAGILLIAYGVTFGLAMNAEKKADAVFATMAASAPDTRYPLVAAKNESALKLEQLALPLEIDIKPRSEEMSGRPELDGALRESMSTWLRKQQERPDDSIEPLPQDVKTWLENNRASIDAVATFLATADTPRWPMVEPTSLTSLADQPIPNLLGHMTLFRVLNVAALDSASRGDHAHAWELLHAASNLSRGIRERRELISQLIAVAGVRMHSATARKLEPPLPAWFSEIADPPFRESVFDAIRFETAWSSATIRDDHWDVKFAQTGQKSNLLEATATKATQPLIRWAFAENNRVIGQDLLVLHGTDPCAIDTTKSTERIEANLSRLTPKLGAMATFAMSNQATAISRAVIADVAVEGTNRILALKAARNADPQRAWPASFESDSSICRDARWAYQRGPDGTALLQFTGQVKLPPGFSGTKIPLEYRGAPPPVKSVSGS